MVVALFDVRYVTGQRHAAEFVASTPQPQRALGLWFARFLNQRPALPFRFSLDATHIT
jgi:hypothetical protein